MKFLSRRLFVEIIAFLFIFLFMYTASDKLVNQLRFRTVMGASPLIGFAAGFLAWAVPVTEIAISLLLLVPSTRRTGLLSTFFLMALFTLYIGYMLAFTPKLPCSCGGVISSMSWKEHLFFNLASLVLAGMAYRSGKHKDFIAINRNSRKPVEMSRRIHDLKNQT